MKAAWDRNEGTARDTDFFRDAYNEALRARAKFPEQNKFVMLAALTEEVGELAQAVLQNQYQPEKNVSFFDIRNEAIQVAAMALRMVTDCTDLQPVNLDEVLSPQAKAFIEMAERAKRGD